MVYKHTVSFIGNIKRDIFIRLLCGSTAVLVPDIHALSIFYKRRKTLAKSIDQLANGK